MLKKISKSLIATLTITVLTVTGIASTVAQPEGYDGPALDWIETFEPVEPEEVCVPIKHVPPLRLEEGATFGSYDTFTVLWSFNEDPSLRTTGVRHGEPKMVESMLMVFPFSEWKNNRVNDFTGTTMWVFPPECQSGDELYEGFLTDFRDTLEDMGIVTEIYNADSVYRTWLDDAFEEAGDWY